MVEFSVFVSSNYVSEKHIILKLKFKVDKKVF